MPAELEIRADFDRDTIVVYQAYSPLIAEPALKAQRFMPPFSLGRMTWIKPSFLWMMYRSGWGQKNGQERVLGIRIKRSGWEKALSLGVLTSSREEGPVRIQWDPERSLRGASLPHRSIQVGLSRHIIGEYVTDWTVRIVDETPRARKIYDLLQEGRADDAARHLPAEQVYPVSEAIARRWR